MAMSMITHEEPLRKNSWTRTSIEDAACSLYYQIRHKCEEISHLEIRSKVWP
jgi:hypothetical protein